MSTKRYHEQIQELEGILKRKLGKLGLSSVVEIQLGDLRNRNFCISYKEGVEKAREAIEQLVGLMQLNYPEIRTEREYDSTFEINKIYFSINKEEATEYEARKRHDLLSRMKHELTNISMEKIHKN